MWRTCSRQRRETPTKVAVIGCGSWRRNLAHVFYEFGALAALCDNRPGVLADMEKRYPRVCFVSDVKVVLCNPALEAVVIATPGLSHYRLARAALLDGKHTCVEKPLALYSTEAETLIALAETVGRTLMVGHDLRYHAAIYLKPLNTTTRDTVQFVIGVDGDGEVKRQITLRWRCRMSEPLTRMMVLLSPAMVSPLLVRRLPSRHNTSAQTRVRLQPLVWLFFRAIACYSECARQQNNITLLPSARLARERSMRERDRRKGR